MVELLNAQVNLIAVVVAAVVATVVGMLWYGPLFGKWWRKLNQFDEQPMMKGQLLGFVFNFLASLATAFMLAMFSFYVNATWTFANLAALFSGEAEPTNAMLIGALVAVMAWVFVAASGLNPVLWAKKRKKLYLLDQAFFFVIYVVMGVIVSYPMTY